MKTCTKCQRDLPLGAFQRRSSAADGRRPDCRECVKAYNAARYAEKGDEIRAVIRAYQRRQKKQGPFICPSCGAERPVLHKHHVEPRFLKSVAERGSHLVGEIVELCANCHEDAHRVEGMEPWKNGHSEEANRKRSASIKRFWREHPERMAERNRKISEARTGSASPALIEANRRTTRDRVARQLAEHGWSAHHAACVECGTSERPHKARGLCNACYLKGRRT